jgi:hypothetical protein
MIGRGVRMFILAAVVAAPGAGGGPVIYEPFDYWVPADPPVDPGLGGLGGTSDIGLDGTWSVRDIKGQLRVYEDSVGWGDVGTVGGGVTRHNGNYYSRAQRAVSPGALDGLLDDGGELWFSLITSHLGANMVNTEFFFSLGTDGHYISDNRHQDDGGTERPSGRMLNSGSGVGIQWWRNHLNTVYWDGNEGVPVNSGSKPPKELVIEAVDGVGTLINPVNFVVVRCQWKAAGSMDVIEVYLPDHLLNLGAPIATQSADLDQAQFDTVGFFFKEHPSIDEIRFGATYDDVLPPKE